MADKVPLGMSLMDSMFGGGVPPGTSILLSGSPGTGCREYVYTCVSMISIARHDPELFSVLHGDEAENLYLPEDIHYISLTRSKNTLLREMKNSLSDDMYVSSRKTSFSKTFRGGIFRTRSYPPLG